MVGGGGVCEHLPHGGYRVGFLWQQTHTPTLEHPEGYVHSLEHLEGKELEGL